MAEKKIKVTFTLEEDLYINYKIACLKMRLNPTQELRRHMREVVEADQKVEMEKGE